ncbi:RsmB/NOP family class I SAM-dependent RNA methyltransferase [Acetobacter orleanensis]|uniref:rRNA cytosine-C5-methylase n=1 Tax=Acetobacter orleanensis TaxID=104099 RepID=A0A4Y3TIH3_9PROT|nr:RsmB/NOP family class I SAM-dependent RNA methyltransferase [Acetobacter orleanensis]KXV63153.1 rRNA cytosine-C5-methylase [Acetobacter orleanensis]PCD80218.1 rRNA cytosine-C5-methylase [Acetobacter orleanensis]GAN69048.1 tRNA/rRNA cytosine-C5-methylase [Acetobacter orleanensis JCM 7639]GBR30305.1 tRNA/rRNA cytosine-C5-methylase Nol1/Nop2/Sun [Acetobacter orleanensis NRIC 0473]GEB81544.1 rRNA cytosine-C5-methylase [Acetobacter orleanensis]
MTPSARLGASIDLLTAMEAAPRKPADAVANSFFRERRYIGGGDRRAVSGMVWEIMRAWRRLGWWLTKCGADITPRALAATNLVLKGWPAREIADLFAEGRFAPGALTYAEQDVVTALAGGTLDNADMPRAVRLELPDWLLPRLEETFGETLEAELSALSEPATLDLRVNILRTNRRDAQNALGREGLHAVLTPLSPWGLRLNGRLPVTSTTPFKDGRIEIQDEGSQLVAAIMGVTPEMRVLDYCAGAGGKTLALAMMMENKGHIAACDVSEARLDGAVRRLRRAGVHNVERHLLQAGDKWAKRRAKSFDRVLVDAPCSGTGTWRRNPDARLRMTEQDLEELLVKQSEILDRASSLVKPGGRMVYATCSILRAENASQVEAFLARHSDFQLVPSDSTALPDSLRGTSMFSLTPHQNETDGFFAAVLERKSEADHEPTEL